MGVPNVSENVRGVDTSTLPGPDASIPGEDTGDETARRYRYQWAYAASVCCMLLDETQDVTEVFCEHHEDVLLKHTNSSFTGLQVKTRSSNQKVWKTGDPAVRDACARFAKLEADFPSKFRAFRFLTNHPLYAARNGQDLCHVLDTVKTSAVLSDLPKGALGFLSRVASKAGCSEEIVYRALSKTDATDDLPKIADIEVDLVATLVPIWSRAEEMSYPLVAQVARALIFECERASSLAHDGALPAYLAAVADPKETELAARLAGKRFDQARVLAVLERGICETAPLYGSPDSCVEPGVGRTDLLLRKLDAGGFSAVSRNSAEDLRNKADYLGIVWTKKHGRRRGLQQYGHIRSLMLNDAARSYEATHCENHLFGVQMLSELRSKIAQRREDGSQLYDCSNEHLEGFAYSLTSECKIQWSIDRPWETS